MKFEFSPEEEVFRAEVREFLRENVPADIAGQTYQNNQCIDNQSIRRWLAILDEKGWAVPHWPVEYGGTGWTAMQQHIFMEEMYRVDAVDSAWQGLHMAAPVIIAFGTEAQKARFLPPMRTGEEYWCQGFSEPNAGSDLANLSTSAVLEGGHYVVNGQKIWTSDARFSEWGFFLVRTDPDAARPQMGISFLLIKMDTPGLTVRPIKQINGGEELNEVFLDNVVVPKGNLVGEPNKGWTYAKYLLEKERTTSSYIYYNKRQLDLTRDIARQETTAGGIPLIDTPEYQRKLTRVEMDLHALEWSVLRILADEKPATSLDAVISTLKIRGAEMQQRMSELQLDALGQRSLRYFEMFEDAAPVNAESALWPPYVPGRVSQHLFNRASTIYGGAREVQKNIIAKLAFGL